MPKNDIDNITPLTGIGAEPWCIRERGVDPGARFLRETLFTLGNGYIGMRGTPEEGGAAPRGQTLEGTYLNGFYESEPIVYPENAYGLARTNEFMLNVPNAKRIRPRGRWRDLRPGPWPGAGLRARAGLPHRPADPHRRLGVEQRQAGPHCQPAPGLLRAQAPCRDRSRRHAAEFLGPPAPGSRYRQPGQQPAGRRRPARRFGDHRPQPAAGGTRDLGKRRPARPSVRCTRAAAHPPQRLPAGHRHRGMPARRAGPGRSDRRRPRLRASTPSRARPWCCTSSSPTRARATWRRTRSARTRAPS
jgi:hypothetical protein